MIITRTPLRISFIGGGTDFPDFYEQHNGAVISTAINKYIYVIVKERFDDKIVLHYTRTETIDSIDKVKHDLIREAMRMVGVEKGIEITTLADVPSEGTGLGSSSSMTVGLLHSLYEYSGIAYDTNKLVEDACKIEIDILGKGIGKQDQYIAAYGGLRFISFQKSGIDVSPASKRRIRRQLESRAMLFYTGITRSATEVSNLSRINVDRSTILDKQLRLCLMGLKKLRDEEYDNFASLVDDGWRLKKKLADTITNPEIDELYERAICAGALGCKICGAGGGGFLLALCKPNDRGYIQAELSDYQELNIKFDPEGSKVILNG